MISTLLKDALTSGAMSRAGALLARPALRRFQARLDPRYVNGAVFVGLNGIDRKSVV